MTKDELRKLYPRASEAFIKANITHHSSEREAPKLECCVSHEPLAKNQVKEKHTGRYVISIVAVRKRLLDTDNLCSKFHTDALRYSSAVSSDAPDKTTITTTQRKCTKEEEEHIDITITYI